MILLLLISLVWPSTVQAATYWDDELESGNTGYNLADLNDASAMTFDPSFKFSGSGSLRLNYDSACYPDRILEGFQCGGFMDRNHTGAQTLFQRFYLYLPSSFTVGDTETKLISQIPGNFTWDIVWLFKNGNHTLIAGAVRGLDGIAVEYSADTAHPFDQWVCVETQVTTNTIGSSNGIIRAWMNGTQIMNITNAVMLVSGDSNTNYINTERFYRQVGQGNLWYDKFAVGNTRFNDCAGGGGGGSTAGGGLDF